MAIWSTGGGQQITGKAGSRPRVHATAEDWGHGGPLTDFWFFPNTDYLTASSPALLSALGWITNGTVSFVAGSGADFLGNFTATPDYGTPAHFLVNTSGERLTSPFVFGSYEHRYFIKSVLGWTPKALIAEFFAIWTTASNADTTGGIGFVEAGGAIQTANDHFAMLTSDGTNFILRSGAATTTFALAVDTNPHIWRIEINLADGYCSFKQDGVAIGTGGASGTGVIAVETDLSPNAFGVATTSSNVVGLGTTHIWYE